MRKKKEKVLQCVPKEKIEAYLHIYHAMKKVEDVSGPRYPEVELNEIKSILKKLVRRGRFPKEWGGTSAINSVFARIAAVTEGFYLESNLELKLKHLKNDESKKSGDIPDWPLRFLEYALAWDIRKAVYKEKGVVENHHVTVRDLLKIHGINRTSGDIRQDLRKITDNYAGFFKVLEIYADECKSANIQFLPGNIHDLGGGFIDEIKDILSEGTAAGRDTVTINGK